MDRREGAQWRRVPGNRSVWTLSRKPPPSVWDDVRAWARSGLRIFANFLCMTRLVIARFSPLGYRRRRHWTGAAPPGRRDGV
jgi:hypothetical protein